jgi:hypothetical protein
MAQFPSSRQRRSQSLPVNPGFRFGSRRNLAFPANELQMPRDAWFPQPSHPAAVRQRTLPQWPFNRVRKANKPERSGRCPKFPRFQCSDLDVIECLHEIRSDLSRFLFGYGVGRILFTRLKDVLKRTTILGRASVSKQLDGHGWNRQQEGNQDRCEVKHGADFKPVAGGGSDSTYRKKRFMPPAFVARFFPSPFLGPLPPPLGLGSGVRH